MPDTTLDYGKAAWALKIGTVAPTTNTEADATWGTGGAAGNYLSILCPPDSLTYGAEFLDKPKAMAGGYTYVVHGGKRQFIIEGRGIIVEGEEAGHAANAIPNMNKVMTWITTRQENADSVFYLIIRINSKSAVFYQQTTARYYCGVYCDRFRFTGIRYGHATCQFSFREAWS